MLANDLKSAFVVQWRVLVALMLREARTRYGRRKAGYLWALVEPMLHVSGFYLMFTYRFSYIPLGDSLFIFLASGFPVFFGFRNIMSRTQGGYSSNEALLAYPVVRLMDVFLGRALLEGATWIAVLAIIFCGIIASGTGGLPSSIFEMLTALLALFAIGFGVGVTLGILTEFIPSISNLMSLPMRLLYFTSGLFYLPDVMPLSVRNVLYWNPVLHGITLFREGYYMGYKSNIFDANYLAGWALGSVLLAFVVERVARKPIRNIA